MSTGTAIIQDAGRKIGVHSKASPMSPDDLVIAMGILNSMVEEWLSRSIFLGTVPLEKPADDLSESIDMRNAITNNLAIAMAAEFDNGKTIVSGTLAANAAKSLDFLEKVYRKIPIPNKVVSSTLPRGAGSDRGFRSRAFFGKDATVKN